MGVFTPLPDSVNVDGHPWKKNPVMSWINADTYFVWLFSKTGCSVIYMMPSSNCSLCTMSKWPINVWYKFGTPTSKQPQWVKYLCVCTGTWPLAIETGWRENTLSSMWFRWDWRKSPLYVLLLIKWWFKGFNNVLNFVGVFFWIHDYKKTNVSSMQLTN